jgi:hypothetical protein
MEFLTSYDYHPSEPIESFEGVESFVDALGYRSVQQQVESFIVAGARLDAMRAGYYDDDYMTEGEDLMDIDIPIGREQYTDFSDVQRSVNDFSEYVRQKTSVAKAAQDAKIAADASEYQRLKAEAKVNVSLKERSTGGSDVGKDSTDKT